QTPAPRALVRVPGRARARAGGRGRLEQLAVGPQRRSGRDPWRRRGHAGRGSNASTGCGSSSVWDVKIGADAQATQVNLTPVRTDVATLTHAPTNTSHRNSFELKTYRVTA